MIKDALYSIAITMPDEYPSNFVRVIHGGARGADRLAGYAAKSLGLGLEEYPADWKLGKAAGVIRNQQMLEILLQCSNPEMNLVLAFHDDLENSKGTKDMVERAKKAGIRIKHYSHDGWVWYNRGEG